MVLVHDKFKIAFLASFGYKIRFKKSVTYSTSFKYISKEISLCLEAPLTECHSLTLKLATFAQDFTGVL